jgi:hypothetical protein
MKTILTSATALAAVLALAGCGKSDSADELANPDNVEMPAEEAMGGLDPSAAPVTDAAALPGADATAAAATDAAAEASAAPSEAAAARQ